MLKSIRVEILIIGILFLSISILYGFNISFYNYFSCVNYILQQLHLIEFFEKINTLGNSIWYFLIAFFSFIVCHFLSKINIFKKYRDNIKKIQFFNFLLFLSILSSGILTQLIKHVVGRPRPSVLNLQSEFGLKFFTFDSSFHSFPSGHTSTIFAVALVVSLMAPKLKYFFYFLAIIVSFSRIVVSEHYITDLIGGVAAALIGFKFSKIILSKLLKENQIFIINDSFKLVTFVLALLSVLFTVAPTFDIFFSKLFQNENGNFFLQRHYFNLEILNYSRGINPTILFRKLFLPIMLFYIFILPCFSQKSFFQKLYFGHIFKLKEILFIWFTSFVGLILIINLIFKNFWGRSRPNDIIEFGGTNNFTPWYQITDQCINNCSFVSGDSSVGFTLIVFYFLIKKKKYLWISLFVGFCLGLIRIMEGGHFISDVVFSSVIIFIFYPLCYSYYIKKFHD